MAHSEAATTVVGVAISDPDPDMDWVVGVAIADFDAKPYGVGCVSLRQFDAVAICTNIRHLHDHSAVPDGWAFGSVGLSGAGWFPAQYCIVASSSSSSRVGAAGAASASSSVGAIGAARSTLQLSSAPAALPAPLGQPVSPRPPPPPPPMVDLNGHEWLQAVQFLDSVDHNGFKFVFRSVGLSLHVDVHEGDNTFYVQLRVQELHHLPTERELKFGSKGAHISIGTYKNNRDDVKDVTLLVTNLRPHIKQHEKLGGSISLQWNQTVGMTPTVLDLLYCTEGGSIDVLARKIEKAFSDAFQHAKCPKRMLDRGGSNFHFSVYSAQQV